MPIYDYKCPKCKYEFEDIKPILECDKPSKCPKCGKKAQRIFVAQNCHGTMTFVLKGWCWSNDGYQGKHWKKTKNVFNKDATLKSQTGDKYDWEDQKVFDQAPRKGPSKVKTGRKRV